MEIFNLIFMLKIIAEMKCGKCELVVLYMVKSLCIIIVHSSNIRYWYIRSALTKTYTVL